MRTQPRPWLVRLFAGLEARQLNYVLIRADADLIAQGPEVDLLVHPSSLSGLLEEVERLCQQELDLRVLFWRIFPRHAATIVLGFRSAEGSWDHCRLDVRSGIHKHGDLLIDGTQLNRDDTLWNAELGFRHLADDTEVALLLLRNTADGRPTSERHERILGRGTPTETADAVRRLGYSPHHLHEGRVVSKKGRRGVRALRLSKYLVRSAKSRVRASGGGLNVVLYGPDGVGKSSQAERLAAFLRGSGVPSRFIHTYHALIRTTKLAKRTTSPATAGKSLMFKRLRSRPAQAALLIVSFARRLGLIRARLQPKLSQGAIVIHDRYLLDVFLKSHKTQGRRFRFLEGALSRLSPRNDAVFLLRCDAATVSQRSHELSPEDVRAAYRLLDDCLRSTRSHWIEIDAGNPMSAVQAELTEHITRIQTQRFSTR